jgi:hypothetical protein
MNQTFKLAEDVIDDLGFTTEFFIDGPSHRASVRLPNYIGRKEQERLAGIIVSALNVDARYQEKR